MGTAPRIVSLAPSNTDIVHVLERNVEGLKQRGLPYMVLDPHSLDEIWQNGDPSGIKQRAGALRGLRPVSFAI